MIRTVPQEQAAAFSLLRREQLATDLLPEHRWESFHQGFLERCGLNPALARRARTALGNVWVIPGDGWICLSLAASHDLSSIDGGGLACNLVEHAIAGGLVTWTASHSGTGQMVQGLAPDGVSEVTLIAADESTITAAVSENTYGVDLGQVVAGVRIGGRTVLSLGVPGR